MFKVGGKPHDRAHSSHPGCKQAAATNGSGHRSSSVRNVNHNSSKPLSLMSAKQHFNDPHDVHRRSNPCGRRDESRGELLGAECKVVSVCGRRERSKLNDRDWIGQIIIDWKSIGMVSPASKTEALLDKYAEVFEEGLGTINTFVASQSVKPECKHRFHKARPVPFALKPAIEHELDCLEEAGIIQKVARSLWAAPVVPVPKGDGQIRLCGDYKVTINPELEIDQYPLPCPSLRNILQGRQVGRDLRKLT